MTDGRQAFAAFAHSRNPCGKNRLDASANFLPEDRRGAIGRNADHDRRTLDDAAELEIAEGGTIHDIDRHAGAVRGVAETLRLVVVSTSPIASAQPCMSDGAQPRADDFDVGDFVSRDAHFFAGLGGEHADLRAARGQKLGFPCGAIAAARQQHRLAGELEENRQGCERSKTRVGAASGLR